MTPRHDDDESGEVGVRRYSPDSRYNPRGKYERATDKELTPVEFAMEMVRKHGPWMAVAAYLIYLISGEFRASITDTNQKVNSLHEELHSHSSDNLFMLRQLCINTSVQAGVKPELCDPYNPQNKR